MNLYVIEAERPQADKTLIKEMQYVVAGSLRAALDWSLRTGTPEAELIGIRCACPVVAVIPETDMLARRMQANPTKPADSYHGQEHEECATCQQGLNPCKPKEPLSACSSGRVSE
jgi:hypothetical protein